MTGTLAVPGTKRSVNSPALGFAWLIWREHRIGLVASMCVWLVFAVLANTAFAGAARMGFSGPVFFCCFFPPCGILQLVFLSGLGPQLSASGSGYPAHLLRLPVRTSWLVLHPLLIIVAATSVMWLATVKLIIVPLGWSAPLLWPIAMLAAMTACYQCASWAPVGGLRIILLMVSICGVGGYGLTAGIHGVSPTYLLWLFSGILAAVVPVTIAAMHVGRRGDAIDWSPLSARIDRKRTPLPKPFASSADADEWIGWRAVGAVRVGIVTVLLVFSLWYPFSTGLKPFYGDISATDWAQMFPVVVIMLLLWSSAGGGFAACYPAGFQLMRPVSTSDIARVRFRILVRCVLSSLAAVTPFAVLWLLAPASEDDERGSLGLLILAGHDWHTIPVVCVGLICAAIAGLRLAIDGALTALTIGIPKARWIPAAYFFGLVIPSVCWLVGILNHKITLNDLPIAWPILLVGATSLKLVASGVVVIAISRKRYFTARVLAVQVSLWCFAALALFGLATVALPNAPVWVIASLAILAVPACRVGLLPLAIEWNRHR